MIAGPTANLVAPIDGGTIDVNSLNSRNWIDVVFPEAPVGYAIDYATITDLAPEFTLGGEGLGSIKLDGSQAPFVRDPATPRTVRYWVNGVFAPEGDVLVNFLAGAWSMKATTPPTPTTLNPGDLGATSFVVTFPAVPAGFTLDVASIADAAHEFTLGGDGRGTAQLHATQAPVLVDAAAGTVRYFLASATAFAATGDVTATWSADSWSITPTGESTLNLNNRAVDNDRSYIDVQFVPTKRLGDAIDDDYDRRRRARVHRSAGAVTIDSGDPIALGGGRYRYLLTRRLRARPGHRHVRGGQLRRSPGPPRSRTSRRTSSSRSSAR